MSEERRLSLKCPNPECGTVWQISLSTPEKDRRIECGFGNKSFALADEHIRTARKALGDSE